MDILQNFNLLSVGVAAAGMILLAAAIYFTDRKSATNRTFIYLAFWAVAWSICNYFIYEITNSTLALWTLRLLMFFAVWFAFSVFRFTYIFPGNTFNFPRYYKPLIIPVVFLVSILTLTPLVFSEVESVFPNGTLDKVKNGPGIALFGALVVYLLGTGIFRLIRNTIKVKGIEKRQLKTVLWGISITISLILIFNFLLPAFFQNSSFIPLGAIFIFPFIAATFYAIYKHHLLNIKIISTSVLTFALSVATFIEVVIATDINTIILRSGVFILVLVFSVLLIKGVYREVEQREKIEKLAGDLESSNVELEKANEKLKELDQMKSQFVSLATHQIRAPLTAIKGYASMILEGDFGHVSEDIKRTVNIILQSTQNLVTIVGDFLDISRIEQGRMVYDMKDFDLKETAEAIIKELEPNVKSRGLEISFESEPGKDYIVNADLNKIRQVISNLIDNSIKYTPKGSIKVSVSRSKNILLIVVKDTGVGIPKEELPKLFQKFARAKNANQVNTQGTGLGLYVAKEMIVAQNGNVWAESDGKDKGSSFHIELPAKNSEAKTGTKSKRGRKPKSASPAEPAQVSEPVQPTQTVSAPAPASVEKVETIPTFQPVNDTVETKKI